MKNLAILLAAFAAFASFAADSVSLYDGSAAKLATPARVVAVRALSSVADGSVTVKAESKLLATRDNVVTTYLTNAVYTVVFSNGVNVVTNESTTVAGVMPLPPPRALIRYFTNETVTVSSVTNIELYTAGVFTNVLATFTCANGFAEKPVTNAFIFAGDRVFFDGTAKGNVTLITE